MEPLLAVVSHLNQLSTPSSNNCTIHCVLLT